MTPINTTCPYCGVGCGVLAQVTGERQLSVRGDPKHPSNFGRLCSKGSALGDTVTLENRLLYPEIDGVRAGWDQALDAVAAALTEVIARHGPEAVALYGSGQLLTEDYYVANKFIKGFIGSANIDTNSRLCMSSAVVGYQRAFGADAVPCDYRDLEEAELVVLVGSNTAWCHPVAFQRIMQAKQARPELTIVVIDPRRTATADMADCFLPVKPGADSVLFNGLLVYLAQQGALDSAFIDRYCEGFDAALTMAWQSAATIADVARDCELPEDQVRAFFETFAATEKTVTVYSQGINQSSSGSNKCNAIINCHLATGRIGRPGMGPFSFTGQPNAMGGREVGGLATTLAAHLGFDRRERLARFWGSDRIPEQPGLTAVELFDAVADGRIKAIWILATNPVATLPDADKVKDALSRCPWVIVSDCSRATDTVELAKIRLPAAGWSEKDGTVTNMERRISRQRALFAPAGDARPDWWIISQVAIRMGFGEAFGFNSSAEVFREHAALSGFENDGERAFDISALADLDQAGYDALAPVQWPVNRHYPRGKARLFDDFRFYTASNKARFLAVTPRPPANAPGLKFPFILNTGRLRDQWHTMTRTGLSPRLNSHQPEPWLELNPQDARSLNLAEHDLATVASAHGRLIVRVTIKDGQRSGSVFLPMHWSNQHSHGRVCALVNPVLDPDSKQPESKQTPVSVTPFRPLWQARLWSRSALKPEGLAYWVAGKAGHCYRYFLAGSEPAADWPGFRPFPESGAVIGYRDAETGIQRGAVLAGGRLEQCWFVAREPVRVDDAWLESLFAETELSRDLCLGLLTGTPAKPGEYAGRIVCACFNVGENTIAQAVSRYRLTSVEAIGQHLRAGTGCGACRPELQGLLQASLTSE